MTPAPRPIAVLLAVALAAPAAASPRLALAPVRGEGGRALDAQLEGALCPPGRCLLGVLSGPRPELERARRAGAEGTLLGSIWRERTGRVLSLALFGRTSRPERTWILPLGPDGQVPSGRLASLARELEEALGPERPPAVVTSPAPPPASRGVAPEPTPSAPPEVRREPIERRMPAPRRPDRPPIGGPLALELGTESLRRSLRFPNGGTAPVGYAVSLPAVPRLAIELRPLALAGGRLAGLSLFGEASWLPGIRLPSGDRTHEATFLALRAGLRWRLPLADHLALVPGAAWERTSFLVAPADGTRVPGLPDDRRTGPSVELGVEVPVAGPSEVPRVALLGAVRAAWWLEAGELSGEAAFFPGGRAWTLEAEAGVSLRMGSAWFLRAAATWASTRWALDPDPSGAYTVRSAQADALGGRLTLRFAP